MRRNDGRETWYRLLEWDKGQTAAERLAAIILLHEGFNDVDPSHPLGGKDGGKDILCKFNESKWLGAVYFPRGQKEFKYIKEKYIHDFAGVKKNNAKGIVFITNQELRLSERKELEQYDVSIDVRIYHLERIASLLNTPKFYGVRLEFLDIEMTKEEQLSCFTINDNKIDNIEKALENLNNKIKNKFNENIVSDNSLQEMRTINEVVEAANEFCDKIWFDRHLSLKFRIERGLDTCDEVIWKCALKSAQDVIEKYGEENLGPYSDFEWGMLNGKLSALRWILGEEWDMLDT